MQQLHIAHFFFRFVALSLYLSWPLYVIYLARLYKFLMRCHAIVHNFFVVAITALLLLLFSTLSFFTILYKLLSQIPVATFPFSHLFLFKCKLLYLCKRFFSMPAYRVMQRNFSWKFSILKPISLCRIALSHHNGYRASPSSDTITNDGV